MTADFEDDFDPAPDATVEPSYRFKLGGRVWSCRPVGQVPWNLARQVFSLDDDGTFGIVVEPFFRGVLIPAEVDAFLEMLNAADSPLTEENAEPLMQKVTEKVFARPTKPSAGSGKQRRRRSSAAGSSSPDTPRIASVG